MIRRPALVTGFKGGRLDARTAPSFALPASHDLRLGVYEARSSCFVRKSMQTDAAERVADAIFGAS